MNIYDVLRRMIEARPFQDFERVEALKLLDDLEALNVLGTVAKNTSEGHEHNWIEWKTSQAPGRWDGSRWVQPEERTYWRRCTICSLEEAVQ